MIVTKAFLVEVRLMSQGQLFEALTLKESSFIDPESLIQRIDEVLGGILIDTHNFREEELKSGRVKIEA